MINVTSCKKIWISDLYVLVITGETYWTDPGIFSMWC